MIDPQNIFLPPLHIKLRLMENVVKAIDRKGKGFKYVKDSFSNVSDVKLKEGIIVSPQIGKLLDDGDFVGRISTTELSA